ncbi:MAG: GntR family transcriptional regulator [Actinomycetales bacterium]|nr:GntR family transcriptional regulator [Actinomycetales bacterium]
MLTRIDPSSPQPLFEQLAASVRGELARGALRPGDRLPAARELAASLDINLHTVLKAYQLLRDEGLLEMRRGRGAIVTAEGRIDPELVRGVRELVASARRLGVAPATLVALVREESQS